MKKGKYVKNIRVYGGKSSYTTNPAYAVKYDTKEEAKKNACEDESVVKMSLQ